MSLDSLPYLDNVRIAPLFGKDEEAILELKQQLNEMSLLTNDFVVLLGTSTIIATLGLFQNSAAVIIGAMIIAPLMRPLMGLAYGSLIANVFLIRRALWTVFVGTIVSVFIAFLFATLLQGIEVTSEISSRIHPNLLDMGVAIFAGCAGAYCQTRKELADTLAGVAISVALVPPLGVVGIGLALGQSKIWLGAGLLYATNLVGIAFAAIIVFLLMGYGPIKRAGKSLSVSLVLVLSLMIPLALSMHELLLEHELSAKIRQMLRKKTYTFKGIQVSKVEVKRFREPMLVTATVLSGGNEINSNQVRLVQDFLTKETGVPTEFRLRVIPSTVVTAIEVTSQGEKSKTVPVGTPLDNSSLDWQDIRHEGVETPDLGLVKKEQPETWIQDFRRSEPSDHELFVDRFGKVMEDGGVSDSPVDSVREPKVKTEEGKPQEDKGQDFGVDRASGLQVPSGKQRPVQNKDETGKVPLKIKD
ncbi:MAG: TIGR00341 family protein [Candidatus Obscuribacterales bacterium]|nr:TIGR00341 family protein [Candidatus Obscuribacterales bacterium]